MKFKKRTYQRTIIIGFVALYFFTMLLSTYLVKEKYSAEYARNMRIMERMMSTYYNRRPEEQFLEINSIPSYHYLIEFYGMETDRQQFSFTLYDKDDHKVAETDGENLLEFGKEYYEKWVGDAFLQKYPDYYRSHGNVESARTLSGLEVNDEVALTLFIVNPDSETYAGTYTMLIRSTSHPLIAALDYLKYIYLIGFLLMLLCIFAVSYSVSRTYKKRRILSETKRDFTNAVAHELKTPLGIIRNFTENLLEHTQDEKETYYLEQIVKQTETMKDMTQEMIYISKLDSEHIKLTKEPVTFLTLMEEQYEKLEPLADEKNLEIRYKTDGEFVALGDKVYLEKAVWNILSNAIVYNRRDGIINVRMTSDACSIENTGTPIAKEALPHVFDMFFTSDESRNSKDKHLGLGLYLVKRILDMHHLKVSIENTDIGVKVTMRKPAKEVRS